MKIIKLSLLAGASLLLAFPSQGQYAADAFRFSEINQTGTARFQGVGGNHAALGGDGSTISGNPAGLGFYNRSELSISPAFRNLNTETTYLGRVQSDSKTNPNLAQASLIIAGSPNRYNSNWKRTSIGISYTRQQSFQNLFTYSGRNERSAYVDAVVDQLNAQEPPISAQALGDDYDKSAQRSDYLDAAYYNLYLIDATSALGPPYFRYDRDKPVNQSGSFESTGAHSQWTFAYAGNYNDKIYVGGSVGFSRIKYNSTNSITDEFVGGTAFRSSNHTENVSVTGNGVNLTVGIIYKATPDLQIGASIVTPTFMKINENFDEYAKVDVIGVPGTDANGKPILVGPEATKIYVLPSNFVYNVQSPFRASGGATYFFGKNGFLTGTIEYVDYSGIRLTTNSDDPSRDSDFRINNREEVKRDNQGGINIKLGGEYRSGTFRARVGGAYYSDPLIRLKDGVKRSRLFYSGGLGFRNDRFFADVTGIYNTAKSAFTPYVLNNSSDYASAQISSKSINVLISLGTFF